MDMEKEKSTDVNKNLQEKPDFRLFDAKGKILGRLATEIAVFLNGKDKVNFDPSKDNRNWAIVINSDKVRLSAEKAKKKIYWRFSGYPGGIYKRTFEEMMAVDSRKVIEKAVKGMLPKNKLSSEKLKRLRVFVDEKNTYSKEFISK